MDVEKIVELMKANRIILGADLTGIEHISDTSTRIVNCTLYEDLGVFVPVEKSKLKLMVKDIYDIINRFNGDLWSTSDTFLLSNRFIRYFAAHEPNKVLWSK